MRQVNIRMFSKYLMLMVAVFALLSPVAQAETLNSGGVISAGAASTSPLSSYRLGRGDVLSVRVFGEDDMSVDKIRLTDAGTFTHPVLGEMRVLGMTVGELERVITDGLRGRYLVNPRVSVRIDEYRPFFINGVVFKPGAYPYQPGLTVQQAASLGGGFKDTADRDNITVVRESKLTLGPQKAALDTPILPGDTVVVPEFLPLFVSGMVYKPGGYPYQLGMTVQKAASLAGGFKDTADLNNITIIRAGQAQLGPQKAMLDAPVYPGDTVEVAEFLQFFVNGMVYKPGGYPFQLGMNVQKAVSIAGGFKERASLSKIYVIRQGDLTSQKEKVELTTPINQGDIITVEESFF